MSGHSRRVITRSPLSILALIALCVAIAGCESDHSASGTGSSGMPTGTGPPELQAPTFPSSQYAGIAQGATGAESAAKVSIQFDPFHPGQVRLTATASLAFESNDNIALSGGYEVFNGRLGLAGSGWELVGHLADGRFVGVLNHNGAPVGSWSAVPQPRGQTVMVVLGTGHDDNHAAVRFDFYVTGQNVSAFLLGDSQWMSLSGRYDVANRIVRFQTADGTAAGSGLFRADGSAQGGYDVPGFGKGTWTGSVR
jgi:hypothetical protein